MDIVVYSTSWCGDCHRLKNFFKQNKVKYKEIDIDTSEEAKNKVAKINNGKHIVPTVIIKGKSYSNPDLEDLEDILEV